MNWHYAVSDLVLPPLGFAWLALIAIIAASRSRRRRDWALGVASLSLLGLLALSTPNIGTHLLISLESGLPTQPPPGAPPQAIVILSGDSVWTIHGPRVGPLTLERMLAGVGLYHRTHLPILVAGGAIEKSGDTFAGLMARVMENDFQVPVRWQEDRSTTTWENAKFSADILGPLGIRSVYVVTHAWHERRALLAFRHFGMIPTAAPVAFEAPGEGFVPSPTGLARSFDALHEWLGLLDYWLRERLSRPASGSPANSAA